MTYIIAEIGTSHQGSIEKAKDLISAARDSGADCVKFQWVYADEILHPDTGFVELPTGKIRLYDRFKELEVKPDFFEKALFFAHECGVDFACSPFGLKSLSQLLQINPDAVKIASPELNHFPMLKALAKARTHKDIPVILSSGVSKIEDIQKAIRILNSKSLSLLHYITFYPAPEEEYNLKVLETLKNQFKITVGVSDHSLNPELVPCLSVCCGGSIIEKHITLSRETDGLDDPVALTPQLFTQMVNSVRKTENFLKTFKTTTTSTIPDFLIEKYSRTKIERVLGDGIKRLAPSEEANYSRTNRSLHFLHAMKSGEKITAEDIAVLRTEKVLTPGISPEYLDEIPGKVLSKDVSSGEGVRWEQF